MRAHGATSVATAAKVAVVIVCMAGCRHAAEVNRWTTVVADFGSVDVPCGWRVVTQAQPDQPAARAFWLVPEQGLVVFMHGLGARDASEEELEQWVLRFNQHTFSDVRVGERRVFQYPEGRIHCAISVAAKTSAACVLFPRRDRIGIVPVAYVVEVSNDRFRAVGGLDVLSRVVSSGREFADALSTTPRRVP